MRLAVPDEDAFRDEQRVGIVLLRRGGVIVIGPLAAHDDRGTADEADDGFAVFGRVQRDRVGAGAGGDGRRLLRGGIGAVLQNLSDLDVAFGEKRLAAVAGIGLEGEEVAQFLYFSE